MIGTSVPEYIFIRISIFLLRAITPLSALFLAIVIYRNQPLAWYFRALTVWAATEVVFFVFVYIPRKWYLEQPIVHPPLPSLAKRFEVFKRCQDTITEPERYLVKWFEDAPLSEVKKDNIKDFFQWSFFNDSPKPDQYIGEMQEYVEGMEKVLGRSFESGRGKATPMRLTIDPIRMVHRTLLWYLIVFFVDLYTHAVFTYHGFSFYRCPLRPIPQVFPLRPQAVLTRHISTSRSISYWYKPHTSRTRRPILFLHGIGIGLMPYIPYLEELTRREPGDDGQVGCIIIELLPISFRITTPALPRAQLLRELSAVLKAHPEYDDGFVLSAHSYGSVITTWMLKFTPISTKISSVILIDPVTLLLHLPDVAYNFTFRKPRYANEWQLWYFASTDPDVAHALARRFFWSENVLWKEDLQDFLEGKPRSERFQRQHNSSEASSATAIANERAQSRSPSGTGTGNIVRDRKIAIFLGGRDLIVNTPAVWNYLTNTSRDESNDLWSTENDELSVFWAAELDHAQIFDSPVRRSKLVEETKKLLERD